MTHTGKCLSAVGVKPIVTYQHKFDNTYLGGSYSPINGDSFVWEVNGVSAAIFEQYLNDFSEYKPQEYKIVIIDNAGFHSTKNIQVPENIYLLKIPPYSPELNPCEQIWQHLKKLFKNKSFETIHQIKQWLYEHVNIMTPELIKSIVSNHHYLNVFNTSFYS